MFFDDEEKRRRQMQGWGNNSDGWGNNTPNQTPYTPNPMQATPRPMEEMTTREALEAAWNNQNPYGGEVKMTGPLGDFSYYDENLNKPKEDQQQGWGQTPAPYQDIGNRFDQYSQKFSSPLLNGLESMNKQDWINVSSDSALGGERILDKRTNGWYAKISPKIGTNYQQRYDNYLKQATESGVGNLARFVDKALDAGNDLIDYASPKKLLTSPLSLKYDFLDKARNVLKDNTLTTPTTNHNVSPSTQAPLQQPMMTPTPWSNHSQQTSTPLNQNDEDLMSRYRRWTRLF